MKRGDRGAAGFTVIELLVTILIVAGLFGLSIWVSHEKNYKPQLNDAQRQLDVATIMQGLNSYFHATGSLPPGLTSTPKMISSQTSDLVWCTSLVPLYLKQIPIDPEIGGSLTKGSCTQDTYIYSSGYTVEQAADGTVTVSAPITNEGGAYSVSRKF